MKFYPGVAMHRKIRFAAFLIALIWVLSIAWSGNPPNGRTGAPGDGLCSDCHSQTNPPQDGNISVDFPLTINANQTYSLIVTVNNPNGLADLAGFQMTVLNSNDQKAGTLSNPSANSVVTPSNSREYHEHNPAQSFPGNNMVTWTVDWIAPSGPNMDAITFYAAGIVANGNGNNSGDLFATITGSGTLMATADPLSVTISNSENVLCHGDASGSATATASDGTPPYTYLWSNGEGGQTILDLPAGIYTVTVTDQAAETSTAQVEITEPDAIVISTTSITDVTCPGGNDGAVDINVSGGVMPYQYEWPTGATTEDVSNLAAGNYSVTVSDQNGCGTEFNIFINQPLVIDVVVDEMTQIQCFGDLASASLSATGGTGSFTYLWPAGLIGPTQTNLSAGTYLVTVTDDNGCTSTEFLFFDEPDELIIEVEVIEDALCFGDNTGGIEVSTAGGTGVHLVDWSNGASGTTILELTAGTYTATVTDENLCTATISVEVGEPDELIASIAFSSQVSCFGVNDGFIELEIDGGTPEYIISWSNGEIGSSVQNLGPGTYTALIEDVNVCMTEIEFVVGELSPISVTGTVMNESAPGVEDGAITLSVSGGSPPYTYLWNNGVNQQNLTGLLPGTYEVTITDVNGCMSMMSFQVGSTGCIIALETNQTNLTCFEANDGMAEVTYSGAFEPVQILWSTGDTTSMIKGLSAIIYTVTVTDANNCQAQASIHLTQPSLITFSCSLAVATGANNADGFVECVAMGGNPPFSYFWSTGDTTTTNADLMPGEYSLTVTDASGCQASELITIDTSLCVIEYTISSTPASCFGESNGEASFNLMSGAIEPVLYDWSSGGSQSSEFNLPTGVHYVTMTDAGGCQIIDSVLITQPDRIMITVDSVQDATNGNDGAIFISVTGGTPPYEYSWVLDNTGISTIEDPTGLVSGFYQINILDANFCFGGQSEIFVDGTTSIQESLKHVKINLFPNPMNDILHIEFAELQDLSIQNIEILSNKGEKIRSIARQQNPLSVRKVEMSELAPGLYYVIIETDGGIFVRKLIKG
jgi:hypothetical protein